jgi:predicted amidohydrolase
MSPESAPTPAKFKTALVQMEPTHLNKAVNLAKMVGFIEEAADAGAKLLIFPELIVTGYVPPYDLREKTRFYEASESVPGPTTDRLQKLAEEKDVFVIFGMVERGANTLGPVMYNVSVMVGPGGFLGVHRKIHLPGGEKLYFKPGNEIAVFDTRLGRIALLVCYDFWFPEVSRIAALKGAQIIVDSANWPAFDTYTWFALGPGVAVSNVLWFAQVNRVGGESYWPGFGGSQIVDPSGRVIAKGADVEGVTYGEIDMAEVERRRMITPVWFDRRPDLYKPIIDDTK